MDGLCALSKQVDSALVSAAEACESLGAHALCAHFYRREIDFTLHLTDFSLPSSTNLTECELAQSWLSLARALIQAPKNTPSAFSPPDQVQLPGSKTPEEALNTALASARACGDQDVLVK